MKVNERVVVGITKTTRNGSAIKRTVRMRRLVMRAVMAARARIIEETGRDIFNVFVFGDDYMEVCIKGDLDARPLTPEELKPWAYKKWKKKKKAESGGA